MVAKRQTVTLYLESLEKLGVAELSERAQELACTEKRATARVIAHLAELSRRKAHLDLGFSSLFDYCVTKLNFSEGATAVRVQLARAVSRFPALLGAVAENQLSLTVAAKLVPHLTMENYREVLEDCAGMTKRQVEEYVVRWAPRPAVNPGIRRAPQTATAQAKSAQAKSAQEQAPAASSRAETPVPGTAPASPNPGHRPTNARNSATDSAAQPPRPSGRVEPCQPELYNVRFAAGVDFKAKLERLAEVIGVDNPHGEIAAVLEQALDAALDQKDPERRRARREKTKREKTKRERTKGKKRSEATEGAQGVAHGEAPTTNLDLVQETPMKPRPDEVSSRHSATDEQPSRYVPVATRDEVFARAAYRCEYTAPAGRRCGARTHLTVDHIHPYGRGGGHEIENLRALCRAHNQRYAESCYGESFVASKIRGNDAGRVGEARRIYRRRMVTVRVPGSARPAARSGGSARPTTHAVRVPAAPHAAAGRCR